MPEPLLRIRDLATHFHVSNGTVKAVDGVDLDVGREEIVTIVGESGSGKSVTALSILGLIREPGRIEQGTILFDGISLLELRPEEFRSIRGARISMIFQNPYTSLHPYFRIGDQMTETLVLRKADSGESAAETAVEMLSRIRVPDPERILQSYPYEVSAGVCQRVMLAMALMGRPELLIADEPTTNLDAVAQVEILDLIREMRDEFRMSVLLITHDFGVVSRMADRVVVMYAGRQVESGSASEVLGKACHPYTEGLIRSVPVPGRTTGRLNQIPGEVPDLFRLPPGCSFRPRCAHARQACSEMPPLIPVGPEQLARCWLFAESQPA